MFNKDIYQKYECICDNCSNLFFSYDEEMTLCPECWTKFIQNQMANNSKNNLVKEFLDKVANEMNQ